VEPEETAVSRQRFGEHLHAETIHKPKNFGRGHRKQNDPVSLFFLKNKEENRLKTVLMVTVIAEYNLFLKM
jgi:hypothetical protein